MYTDLSEILGKGSQEKTVIQSRKVVPKKHFFRVKYFSSCGKPLLNGYAISSKSSCDYCIYKMYLTDISI